MIELITIQHKAVVSLLSSGKDYYAQFKNVKGKNLIEPYKIMMKHYGWCSVPIFCAVPDKQSHFIGANTINSMAIILHIPETDEDLVKYQSYYDWSDLIYYMEYPEDLGNDGINMKIVYNNALRTSVGDIYWQATLPFIKSAWVKDIIDLSTFSNNQLIDFVDGNISLQQLISFRKETFNNTKLFGGKI